MKGQITIFLCLILTVVCSLSLTIVRGCRLQSIKWKMQSKAELDKNYLLSEYDKTLREKYGVFFLSAIEDEEELQKKLEQCAEESEKRQTDSSDYLPAKLESVQIENMCMATDNNGNAFFHQAVKEEYQYLGEDASDAVDRILSLTNLLKNAKNSQKEGEEKKNQKIELDPNVQIDEEEKKKAEEVKNPAEVVEELKKDKESFWFGEKGLSEKKINIKSAVSNRQIQEGNYLYGEQKSTISDEALFVLYLMRHFSDYGSENKEGALSYELEYILKGKNTDKANVKAVAFDIFAIREACNFAYLVSDGQAQGEAEAIAAALTGYLLNPVVTEAAKYLILLAWSSAESILDVKNLLNDASVPFIKNKATWQLSLTGITDVAAVKNQRKQSQEGLCYEDYLKILLVTSQRKAITMRAMDVMEWEVRRLTENKKFKIDDCVAGFQGIYNYSALGKTFTYTTQGGY